MNKLGLAAAGSCWQTHLQGNIFLGLRARLHCGRSHSAQLDSLCLQITKLVQNTNKELRTLEDREGVPIGKRTGVLPPLYMCMP